MGYAVASRHLLIPLFGDGKCPAERGGGAGDGKGQGGNGGSVNVLPVTFLGFFEVRSLLCFRQIEKIRKILMGEDLQDPLPLLATGNQPDIKEAHILSHTVY